MSGDFLENSLGALVVIPKFGFGGEFFQFYDFIAALVQVKGTSRVYPVFPSIPGLCFLFQRALNEFLVLNWFVDFRQSP
jgi:hypothetical protein